MDTLNKITEVEDKKGEEENEDEEEKDEEKKKKEEEEKKEAEALALNQAEDEDVEMVEDNENLFDINNSIFDFRYLIIGQKLSSYKEGEESYSFDDYTLSEMVNNMTTNTNIFNQTSVKRIIDHQFRETKVAMQIKFAIFMLLYYIPFIVVCFTPQQQVEALIMTLSFGSQLYFYFIEVVQMKQKGIIEYAKEGFWNFVETSQFFVFMALYILRAVDTFSDSNRDGVDVIVLQLYLMVVGFVKILFFIRIYEEYGFLVQMVGNTVIQLIPFLVFFIMWILFFAILYWILKVEIDSGDEEYLNLPNFFKYFFMTYRNSIGDISVPGYTNWDKSLSNDVTSEFTSKNFMIFLIWMVWLVNQFVNLIILLNFLIAVISQVYDNVVADQ